MKRYGKVTIAVIVLGLLVSTLILWILPERVEAASYRSGNWSLGYNGETAKTAVFRRIDTGDVISATDGSSTASTTWAAGENEASQHSVSNDWVFTVPAMSMRYSRVTVYDVAASSVTKATTPSAGPWIYDAKLKMVVLEAALE